MKKYYLVSFGLDPKDDFYWTVDLDDNWRNILNNIVVSKEKGDVIKEVATASEPSHLDWKKTPLNNPSSHTGWLSRYGRFYGCPPDFHDKHAYYIIGKNPSDLENRGWVRVLDSKYYSYATNLSAEQKNWLSENGYKLYD